MTLEEMEMTIRASKEFGAYVAHEELPRTGDARKFVIRLPFAIESTNRIESRQWEWKYSGTQEQLDTNAGIDGLAARQKENLEAFRRHIERELRERSEQLYEVEGQRILVRGPLQGAGGVN